MIYSQFCGGLVHGNSMFVPEIDSSLHQMMLWTFVGKWNAWEGIKPDASQQQNRIVSRWEAPSTFADTRFIYFQMKRRRCTTERLLTKLVRWIRLQGKSMPGCLSYWRSWFSWKSQRSGGKDSLNWQSAFVPLCRHARTWLILVAMS